MRWDLIVVKLADQFYFFGTYDIVSFDLTNGSNHTSDWIRWLSFEGQTSGNIPISLPIVGVDQLDQQLDPTAPSSSHLISWFPTILVVCQSKATVKTERVTLTNRWLHVSKTNTNYTTLTFDYDPKGTFIGHCLWLLVKADFLTSDGCDLSSDEWHRIGSISLYSIHSSSNVQWFGRVNILSYDDYERLDL